jgi:hypothetical protein
MPTEQTFHGACHCGRVSFSLQAKITQAYECNCSICHKMGSLWHTATDDQLRILTGEDALKAYQFGTMTARHYFCVDCGVHPFSRPRFDPTRWEVNLRCVDGLDLVALPVRPFDGQNYEAALATAIAEARALKHQAGNVENA